jgi:hypothetical protein
MKYSLRSLMKFSIRDIALLTVIVALAVSWGITYQELARARRREQIWRDNSFEMQHIMKGENAHVGFSNEGEMTVEWVSKSSGSSALPNSQAPAPNPPKQ